MKELARLGLRIALCSALVALAPLPALATGGGTSGPLRILLTNDDGFDAAGILAVRAALIAAGHDVIEVAPLEQQSGKGGSLTVDVGGTIDINRESESPEVWSVDGTPVDSVKAGLLILEEDPPELVVSGANFGQNTSRGAPSSSGTVGAAFSGTLQGPGFPSIAISVGIDLAEADDGFPSTFAAFPEAGEFLVRLIADLQETAPPDGSLLPDRFLLNVNYPPRAPDDIEGIAVTFSGIRSALGVPFLDIFGSIAAGGGPLLIGLVVEPDLDGDSAALQAGFISIVVMDGDMTAPISERSKMSERLKNLAP